MIRDSLVVEIQSLIGVTHYLLHVVTLSCEGCVNTFISALNKSWSAQANLGYQ